MTRAEMVLRRIAAYQSVEELRERSEEDWGLPFEEALEMAYENLLAEANAALDPIPDAED